jgi:Asp/Glu/hydantoin racemase
MRLLFLNPNTSAALTQRGAELARRVARPDTEIVSATARFGARYIATRAAAAIAGHAALDAFAHAQDGCDAVLLACFGDPGLLALRELAPVPVVGMAEASCHAAAALGGKFAIVTGGERWRPMLEECVAAFGLSSRLAAVRTTAPSGGEIAADPDAALPALIGACVAAAADGAEVVILGGLGLAGLADAIKPRVPIPVIDSLVAGVLAAEAAALLRPRRAEQGSFAPAAATETVGLSPALGARLAGG